MTKINTHPLTLLFGSSAIHRRGRSVVVVSIVRVPDRDNFQYVISCTLLWSFCVIIITTFIYPSFLIWEMLPLLYLFNTSSYPSIVYFLCNSRLPRLPSPHDAKMSIILSVSFSANSLLLHATDLQFYEAIFTLSLNFSPLELMI